MSRFELINQGNVTTIHDAETYPGFDPVCFEQGDWHADHTQAHSGTGRGGVLMLELGGSTWVRRHYHRGGIVSRLVYDHYFWNGLERTRPVRELRLLDRMRALELPVPAPVAGRVVRSAFFYRADLITVLLPGTRPLSSAIAANDVDPRVWPRIGSMIARFHGAGIDHPDLTAHNILLDGQGQTFLLDFDNADIRSGTEWQAARMARLRRSLNKVALETGTAYDGTGWASMLDAYSSL